MRRVARVCLAAVVLLVALSGCAPAWVEAGQESVGQRLTLTMGHAIGQTFVAGHGGLSGIQVFLEPVTSCSGGSLRLELLAEPGATEVLAGATIPATTVTAPGYYAFRFAPQPDANGRYYYGRFSLVDGGCAAVNLAAGPANAYRNGSAYSDDRPLDAQVTFRLDYDRAGMVSDLLSWGLGAAGVVAFAAFAFVLPAAALLLWAGGRQRPDWASLATGAGGLGLALYPLLMVWADVAGVRLGVLHAWLPGVLALLYVTYRGRTAWRGLSRRLRSWAASEAVWADGALLLVVALLVLTRLLVVRGLDGPSWGDSVQHAAQAQLLVDNGGLFRSWEPYAPYTSLTTHFGFATVAALLQWGLGWDVLKATLIAGQLVNVLAALGWYPLAVRLAPGRRWAGVGAVLVAGLLAPTPADYANWGRFAQLAGQAVLPIALWLLVEALDRQRGAWRLAALAGVALAGMALCYYRMPYYYAPFVAAWLIAWGVPALRRRWRDWLRAGGKLVATAVAALLLLVPWALRVVGGKLAASVETGTQVTYTWARVVAEYDIWRRVGDYVPPALLALAAVALVVLLARRRWEAVAAGLWALGLAGLVATRLVNLPGANLIDNFAVLIAFYMPVGLLCGCLLAEVSAAVTAVGRRVAPPSLALLVLVVGLWGAKERLATIDPQYIMVMRPDVRAARWIVTNTPPTARFLVEGFRIYNGRSVVGADAGWWLPLMAGRANTMPPQYALLNEVPAEPTYSADVVGLVQQLEQVDVGSVEGMAVLCGAGVTHVYLGQGQGNVGAGVVQLYSAAELSQATRRSEVYHSDLVRIYAVNDGACAGGGG
ncbi:MAG: DUF6541 family protein [Anaerolineae bacterium]